MLLTSAASDPWVLNGAISQREFRHKRQSLLRLFCYTPPKVNYCSYTVGRYLSYVINWVKKVFETFWSPSRSLRDTLKNHSCNWVTCITAIYSVNCTRLTIEMFVEETELYIIRKFRVADVCVWFLTSYKLTLSESSMCELRIIFGKLFECSIGNRTTFISGTITCQWYFYR